MGRVAVDAFITQWSRAFPRRRAGKPWLKLVWWLAIAAIALPGAFAYPVRAGDNQRVVKTTRVMLAHHWVLQRWSTGIAVCDFHIKGEGLPTLQDVQASCTDAVYESWSKTPACTAAIEGNSGACEGLFLRDLGSEEAPVTEILEIPLPSVRIEHTNCPPWTWCDERPNLAFIGFEPMEGQSIKAIHVRLGDQERLCAASICELRMPVTEDKGAQMEYWAESSFGDESPHLILALRNRVPQGKPEKYRLEILGSAWVNEAPPGAVRWGILPSVTNTMAPLLDQPASAAELATQRTYLFLAGGLIKSGMVDAKDCLEGGLYNNGTANTCGEERARSLMVQWQNRYDPQILAAAQIYEVPARLLKALIARETQFWPDSGTPYELGLGRITENGADLLLNWNVGYFLNLCASFYRMNECASGFSNLSAEQQTLLRGKALTSVGTIEEINLIAATLRASSSQVTQMIRNVTQQDISRVATLEDMWALTIGNYHAGSGCVASGLNAIAPFQVTIAWQDVASHLPPGCLAGRTYVDEVVGLAQ